MTKLHKEFCPTRNFRAFARIDFVDFLICVQISKKKKIVHIRYGSDFDFRQITELNWRKRSDGLNALTWWIWISWLISLDFWKKVIEVNCKRKQQTNNNKNKEIKPNARKIKKKRKEKQDHGIYRIITSLTINRIGQQALYCIFITIEKETHKFIAQIYWRVVNKLIIIHSSTTTIITTSTTSTDWQEESCKKNCLFFFLILELFISRCDWIWLFEKSLNTRWIKRRSNHCCLVQRLQLHNLIAVRNLIETTTAQLVDRQSRYCVA